jgi:membrane dipeptidase
MRGVPEVASTAREILSSSADIWDMTLPWLPIYWDMAILKRYRQAGFTFVSLTLQDWPPSLENTRQAIESFKALAEAESDWLIFGTSLADIDRGRREGKLVLGFNSQETRPLGEDLSRIEALHVMGVRHMLLAYNVRNLVADGCAERSDAGLSNFGRQVVKEMDRVGILVDGSHTGRRSSLEAIELSKRPVIFSHSGAYSIYPHFRNLHDDQIRACAERGGVIGVVGVGAFLGDREARAEALFSHIDHIATLVGPRHIGLGTDYVNVLPVSEHAATWSAIDPSKSWPNAAHAWPDPNHKLIPVEESRCFRPEQLSELVAVMLSHGYPIDDIHAILGGNFRRVYSAVL